MSGRDRLAEQVRAGRVRKRWTRGRLAEEVQSTSAEIARIEMSADDVSPDLLHRLVMALDLEEQPAVSRPRHRAAVTAPIPEERPAMPAPSTPVGSPIADLPTEDDAHGPAAWPVVPPAGGAGVAGGAKDRDRAVAPAPVGSRARKARPASMEASGSAGAVHATAPATAPPRVSSPEVEDEQERQVIALLERIAGGHFVYRDGKAWLLRDVDAIAAGTPLLAAYALLTDTLLSGQCAASEAERAELRRLHLALLGVAPPSPGDAGQRARKRR